MTIIGKLEWKHISDIRLKAYRSLGFTEEALDDDDTCIGREAEKYFELKKKYSKEEAKKIIDLWKLEKL